MAEKQSKISSTRLADGRPRRNKINLETDGRLKKNKPGGVQTEAQRANHFKPGNNAAAGNNANRAPHGSETSRRIHVQRFRRQCALLLEISAEMLLELMYDAYDRRDAKGAMEVIKLIAAYGAGRPTELVDDDAVKPQAFAGFIVASEEALRRAQESDMAHEAGDADPT